LKEAEINEEIYKVEIPINNNVYYAPILWLMEEKAETN
jgi:hypothetical protein